MRALIFAAAMLMAPAAFAEPVRYALDPAHTQVAFRIDRFGFNSVLAQFDAVEGEVLIDEANPANSSVRAVIQTASISAGNETRDEHLREPRWLNAAGFPTIIFQSTAVRLTSATTADVTGNLTLLGQTHPVTMQVTLNRHGPLPNNQRQAAGFSATGTLNRSAFGSTTGANVIGDAVRFEIEALAVVPAAPAQ
ncbi:MAG TPA: YceI family protein [Terricaulis sp.]|nr:YceI family protein [Terricaulis sp.]